MIDTDIDIDFFNRDTALKITPGVAAVQMRENERERHLSGVYFHDIPTDPTDGMSVWEYREAEERGYFKVDLLNNFIYEGVRDENHLIELLTTEPPWDVFDDKDVVGSLAQISNHFDIIQSIKPKSLEDLAVCIALLRPGKKHLIGKPRAQIDAEIWLKTDSYYFKKSHALAYSASIIVQLNLLIEKANVL